MNGQHSSHNKNNKGIDSKANRQKGLTLVEITIVLVIIGLLLGGVLKGQELINNAKVKSYASDFRYMPVQFYGYQDKFRFLPGDDPLVATHVPGATLATTPAGRVGNGVIDGAWNTTTNSDESCLFWQHVRLAELGNGSTAVSCAAGSDYWPKNASGGQIGVQSNVNLATFSAGNGPPGTFVICTSNILGRFVLDLDAILDDGNPATGSMRAIQTSAVGGAASSTATVQANPNDSFIVCMGI